MKIKQRKTDMELISIRSQKALRLYNKMHEQKLFTHQEVREHTGLGIMTVFRWRHGTFNLRAKNLEILEKFLVKVLKQHGVSKSLVLSR